VRESSRAPLAAARDAPETRVSAPGARRAGPWVLARTALALGLSNVVRVAGYRVRLRAGIHPVQHLPPREPAAAPFFGPSAHDARVTNAPGVDATSPAVTAPAFRPFGWLAHQGDAPPDWFLDVVTGERAPDPALAWWLIPDFTAERGDIKAVWEASRFEWVLSAARRAREGDAAALDTLDRWLADWSRSNPPGRGPNWKCGQEASIRVMRLAAAALVLDAVRTAGPGVPALVAAHLERIVPTLDYAIAQDNNHGTSEAAALFVGGSWLRAIGDARGEAWQALGSRWLEERVCRLFDADGTFSQYSTRYHRLALDTLALAETWRIRLGLAPFSPAWRERAAAASRWLRAFVQPSTGEVPNIGGNDGANLLALTDSPHGDCRPSAHLAAALFEGGGCALGSADAVRLLDLLGVQAPRLELGEPGSCVFDGGGFAVLRRGGARAVLRYPRFRFRPAHADAGHVDLWVDGENLLRDAGSYSYASRAWHDHLSSVRAHNTVEFDGRDQMPRVGRFLYGSWPRTRAVEPLAEREGSTSFGVAYDTDGGAHHARRLDLSASGLVTTDRLSGFARAVIRWRLRPGRWRLDGTVATDGRHVVRVAGEGCVARCELTTGWESRLYLQKSEVPVLEVGVSRPGEVKTEYRWA
jgi:hypothetical protein